MSSPDPSHDSLLDDIDPDRPAPAARSELLSEAQVAQLAEYVIELGPGLPPKPSDTELVVGDSPLVVRGMLPPISAAGQTQPRGLLIGTTDGFSFEEFKSMMHGDSLSNTSIAACPTNV